MTTIQKKPTSDPSVNNQEKNSVLSMASIFSGPLPPPDAFSKYDITLPGAADRILTLVEGEAIHRRKMEENSLKHNIWIAHLGQIFAFILGMSGLGGAIYCVHIGEPLAASIIFGGSLVALIAPFIRNLKSEKKV